MYFFIEFFVGIVAGNRDGSHMEERYQPRGFGVLAAKPFLHGDCEDAAGGAKR